MSLLPGRVPVTLAGLFVLHLAGGSSPEDSRTPPRWIGVPLPLWVPDAGLLHYADTFSPRQYVLDSAALKYVGDYTNDPQSVRIAPSNGGWTCGTGLLEVRAKIPAGEFTEAALRARARSLVARQMERKP